MNSQLITSLNQSYASLYYYLHYPHQDSITHQAVRMLQHIDMQGDVTIGKLAELLSISHNTASEHVKRLLHNGYVVKERYSSDERKVFVRLTEKGRAALYMNTRLDESKLSDILERLSVEQREIIGEAFHLLAEEAKKCSSY
ncbi:MarR family winged helix-turn-helix transcriptional regulator [Brevibacillus composti]